MSLDRVRVNTLKRLRSVCKGLRSGRMTLHSEGDELDGESFAEDIEEILDYYHANYKR